MAKKKNKKNSFFELSMINTVRDIISLEEIENIGKLLKYQDRGKNTGSEEVKKLKEKEAEE